MSAQSEKLTFRCPQCGATIKRPENPGLWPEGTAVVEILCSACTTSRAGYRDCVCRDKGGAVIPMDGD